MLNGLLGILLTFTCLFLLIGLIGLTVSLLAGETSPPWDWYYLNRKNRETLKANEIARNNAIDNLLRDTDKVSTTKLNFGVDKLRDVYMPSRIVEIRIVKQKKKRK